jgi:hypothetical protein
MIIVRIEVFDPEGTRVIEVGRIGITNDGSGTERVGHYDVEFIDEDVQIDRWKEYQVKRNRGTYDLVKRVMMSLVRRLRAR